MKPLLQLYPQHAIYRLHDGHEHQVHSAVEILNLELNTNVNYYKHSYDVQR